jgi:hypothetical protein
MKAIYLIALAISLQACTIQGYQRFTPTGIRLAPEIGLGTEARKCRQEYQEYRTAEYVEQEQTEYIIGPQYYTLGRPIPSNYRSVRNYMDAPVVGETANGSTVIIPRSWN